MEKKSSAPANRAANLFIEKHQKDVMGILHSFDRLRLQGSLRYLYCAKVFEEYLSQAKVLYKVFKQFATGLTNAVCQGDERMAQALKRPFTYLSLTCNWANACTCTFTWSTDALDCCTCGCKTWFPFLIHICLNGHDWLGRQMDEKGLRYRKADNRFTWLEDFKKSQDLADRQLRTDWVSLCEQLRKTYHPLHDKIARPLDGLSYYWTAPQTEFSSDVLFHDQRVLERLVPRLMLHGMLNLGCEQVMRFLGKQLNGQFGGEVVSDWRRGSEGVRLKHWVNLNSIKLYNCLNVLRPETTIHDAEDLKVF